MAKTPISTTLVFCLKGNKVLLLERRKEPLRGYWLAPGGKIEPAEAPYECARREFFEETGLAAKNCVLRGLVLETSPRDDWQWMLHIYVVTKFSGILKGDHREGKLRWWKLDDLRTLRISEATRIFLDKVLLLTAPVYEATYRYDSDLRLCKTSEYTKIASRSRRAQPRSAKDVAASDTQTVL
jgi:8-oxo-dGTP diphosphatase